MATRLTLDAVADLAWRAGFRGEALVTALAVTSAEDRDHDPDARGVNVDKAGRAGSVDRGLWQINDFWHRELSDADAFDPQKNADAAYKISDGGTNWRPWSTYVSGDYKAFLPEARTAAAAATERAGGPSGSPPPVTVDPAAPVNTRLPISMPYGGAHDALPVDSMPIYPGDLSIAGGVDLSAAQLGPLGPRVTHIGVDLSLREISEISIDVADPGLAAFFAGLTLPGLQVNLADLHFEAVAVNPGPGDAGEHVTITCRDHQAEFFKRDRQPGPTGNMSPVQLLRDTAPQPIAFVVEDDNSDVDVTKSTDTADPAGRLETSWAQLTKLAEDRGYLFNVGQGTAFFARPSFIASAMPGVVVKVAVGVQPRSDHPDAPFLSIGIPDVRRVDSSTDAGKGYNSPNAGLDSPVTGTVRLPQRRAARIRPGMRLELYGMGSFDGPYLITRVNGDVDNDLTPWAVEFETAQDPTPSDPSFAAVATSSTPATTGQPGAGTGQASDFVAFAQSQAGKPYVYGAEVSLSDASPGAFDCSELVQWAAARAGVTIADGSGNQFEACAAAGLLISVEDAAHIRGALLFVGNRGSQHVAISLGDGSRTIEARGTSYGVANQTISSIRWDGAGLIPHMTYQLLSTPQIRHF